MFTPHPLLCALVALSSAVLAAPPEWPQFRGPNCTGVAASAAKPPIEFGPEKNLRWKTGLPSGASSPVIAGDRIFLTGFSDGKLETLALKRSDGTILWRHAAQTEGIEPFFEKSGTPAAPSCATDGEHVVSYFGSCGLLCYDLDGRELWTVKMPVVKLSDAFGSGSSPVIHDGRVYLLRDEEGDFRGLFAYDVKSGRELWRAPRTEFRNSYGTPVLWDGVIVTLGDLRAKAYDAGTGAERWLVRGLCSYPCTTPAAGPDGRLYVATWSTGSANEPVPEYDVLLSLYDKDKGGNLAAAELVGTPLHDFLFIMDDDKNGILEREEWEDMRTSMRAGHNVVLAIKPGGHGDITDSHVAWKNERGSPYVSSPLAADGRLFLTKDGGFATCYNAPTGEILYEKQRLGADGDYYASPIAAAGRIYACSSRGTVVVCKSTDSLEVLARNNLNEPIAATPAIVGDTIYIRTATHIWAFASGDRKP